MKKTTLLILIIFSLFFTSCSNNDFKIEKSEIKLLKKDDILKLEIVDNYIKKQFEINIKDYDPKSMEGWVSDNVQEQSIYSEKILLPSLKKTNQLKSNYDKKRAGKSLSESEEKELNDVFGEYFKQEELIAERKKNEKEKLKKNKSLNCIISNLIILNNTKEIIEKSCLNVVIKFEFENKNYFYLKPYMLGNNKWKPNEKIEHKCTDVLNFSNGYNDLLNVHTPKKVEIAYYITGRNSVGYSNLKKEINELIESGYFSTLEKDYGKFTSSELTKNQKQSLGTEILKTDITDNWNKNKN